MHILRLPMELHLLIYDYALHPNLVTIWRQDPLLRRPVGLKKIRFGPSFRSPCRKCVATLLSICKEIRLEVWPVITAARKHYFMDSNGAEKKNSVKWTKMMGDEGYVHVRHFEYQYLVFPLRTFCLGDFIFQVDMHKKRSWDATLRVTSPYMALHWLATDSVEFERRMESWVRMTFWSLWWGEKFRIFVKRSSSTS
ncbi:hypothetical protein EJ08DRAFT_257592 [Tothia fuscella]|uniref:F-box domain-containing protein n=1 Tax=Tothia fuscella TaxID=1048955 RepID=A0A9P4NQ32_9PEZI|nr:hypothetical protein EJ08DRAFT_257592 [Tothia fuscella]